MAPLNNSQIYVLFVCLGNICRSPTAEGVFRALVEREGLSEHIRIDSAGTSAYHLGEPPDPRARAAAKKRRIDLSRLRARQTAKNDFETFDYILAMDGQNHDNLSRQCPKHEHHRLHYFLDFAPDAGRRDVPDPYMGGTDGFELVLDLIEDASRGLLDHIRQRHLD